MEKQTGLVFDIRKGSVHDGPGVRTTVLLKGCPMSCAWCANPEGQSAAQEILFYAERCTRCGKCIDICQVNAVTEDNGIYFTDHQHCTMCEHCIDICQSQAREISGVLMTSEEVMAIILDEMPTYVETCGGVTFSGGEPMAQRAFVMELLQECRSRGIHTALDTCGFTSWEALDSVRSLVDVFLYDVKLVDEAEHIHYTGVSNHTILENLERLAQHDHKIILRVPLIPGITDTKTNLRQIGELAARLPAISRVDLLPFQETMPKYAHVDREYIMANVTADDHTHDVWAVSTLKKYDLDTRLDE